MEHLAGNHKTGDLRLGDTVVDSKGKAVDAVVINFGYGIPSNGFQQGLKVIKQNPLMGETSEIYLSKEEIFELYAYYRDKGCYIALDS